MQNEQSTEQVDVQETGGDSSPEETSSQSSQSEQSEQEARVDGSQDDINEQRVPYARFKEINDRYRALEEQSSSYAKQFQEMQERQQALESYYKQQLEAMKPQQAEDPLLKELREINPAFAERFQQALSYGDQIAQIQQQLETQQQEAAMSKLDALYAKNNINSEEDKDSYRRNMSAYIMDVERQTGKRVQYNEVEKVFNHVHKIISKEREAYARQVKESYLKDKKADQTPTSQTGGAAKASINPNSLANLSPEEKAQLIAKELKAGTLKI